MRCFLLPHNAKACREIFTSPLFERSFITKEDLAFHTYRTYLKVQLPLLLYLLQKHTPLEKLLFSNSVEKDFFVTTQYPFLPSIIQLRLVNFTDRSLKWEITGLWKRLKGYDHGLSANTRT
jgi:hypothetical protein